MNRPSESNYQAIVAAPGFSIGVRCDEMEVHAIEYLELRSALAPKNALAAEAVRQLTAYLADPDTETARQSMLASLKTVEAASLSSPRNTELLETLAQGYCGYAFMFLEDSEPARAAALLGLV